jgi:hypothetical protein
MIMESSKVPTNVKTPGSFNDKIDSESILELDAAELMSVVGGDKYGGRNIPEFKRYD